MSYTRSGGVAILKLDSDRANALSAELVEALHVNIATAFDDMSVHTLALVGNGRDFCTGFDLSALDRCSDGDLLLRLVRIEKLLSDLWRAPIQTVACVSGRAWGAGADLVVACDVRIATPKASFRFPGAAFGLVLGTRRLSVRIGLDEAIRCVSTGAEMNANDARALGLANMCIAEHEVWLERLSPPVIDRDTMLAVRAAAWFDERDGELAALVRSASVPGLRQRIEHYRDQLRSKSVRASA